MFVYVFNFSFFVDRPIYAEERKAADHKKLPRGLVFTGVLGPAIVFGSDKLKTYRLYEAFNVFGRFLWLIERSL